MTTTLLKFFLLSFLPTMMLISGCKKSPRPANVASVAAHERDLKIKTQSGSITFRVEVVDTEATRAYGLMNREKLDPHRGMLFVFDRMDNHAFWMKNTLISLDIIHFDDSFNVVGIIEHAEPLSLRVLDIDKDSRYVLEVPAGSAKKYGINLHSVGRLSYE